MAFSRVLVSRMDVLLEARKRTMAQSTDGDPVTLGFGNLEAHFFLASSQDILPCLPRACSGGMMYHI